MSTDKTLYNTEKPFIPIDGSSSETSSQLYANGAIILCLHNMCPANFLLKYNIYIVYNTIAYNIQSIHIICYIPTLYNRVSHNGHMRARSRAVYAYYCPIYLAVAVNGRRLSSRIIWITPRKMDRCGIYTSISYCAHVPVYIRMTTNRRYRRERSPCGRVGVIRLLPCRCRTIL